MLICFFISPCLKGCVCVCTYVHKLQTVGLYQVLNTFIAYIKMCIIRMIFGYSPPEPMWQCPIESNLLVAEHSGWGLALCSFVNMKVSAVPPYLTVFLSLCYESHFLVIKELKFFFLLKTMMIWHFHSFCHFIKYILDFFLSCAVMSLMWSSVSTTIILENI